MFDFLFGTHLSVYTTLFVGITLLAIVSRGTAALEWQEGMMVSGVVNTVMQLLQTIGNILLFLLLIPIMGIYNALDLPQLPKEMWDSLPLPLMWLLLLFVYDFCLYWLHRVLHKEWLWPIHAVHHSDEHLHFLSWSRFHPLEITFVGIALTL
ncbi:MAG: sterol desaturase family protein, partial [Maricaulaceae bacterium]